MIGVMESEVAAPDDNVLNEIIAAEDLKRIPEDVCKKLQNAFVEKCSELNAIKALLATNRNIFDKKCSTLENELEGINKEFEESKTKLGLVENSKAELQKEYDKAQQKNLCLENSIFRLEKDNADLKRKYESVSDDRDTFQLQVERRNAELELLRAEIVSLSEQLQAAISAKSNALQDIAEVQNREISVDYKEKRLQQKEDLLNEQNANLREQIANLNSELQTIRADTISQNSIKDTRLALLEEELRIFNDGISNYKDANETLQQRCVFLTNKIEQQRTQELEMHNSYREEVAAQIKLVDLHKELAAEANKKEEEYKEAIKELQNLVQKSMNDYGILETKYRDESENFQEDLEERDRKINKLTDDLKNANELLQNFRQEKMEQAIVRLAPSAVMTQHIMKKGLTMKDMYNQLEECTKELAALKNENEYLKNEMNKIMSAMEEHAPMLQRKLQEHAIALDKVKTLKAQVDELVLKNVSLREDLKDAKRKVYEKVDQVAKIEAEKNYLARKVCTLLNENLKWQRGYSETHEDDYSITIESDECVSSEIISKHLVTFKDIEQLQEKNQQLLSVARALAINKEEVEHLAIEYNTGALKERIRGYEEKIEELTNKNEELDETLMQVCEEYLEYSKTMENQDDESDEDQASNAGNTSESDKKKPMRAKDLKKHLADCEAKVKQLNEELEASKQEKEMHIRLMTDQINKLQKEAGNSSMRCCKLKVQLDSANEQFHLLQANVELYKSQIKTLEESCANYKITIDKNEQNLKLLQDNLMSTKSQLNQTRAQLENCKQSYQLTKENETRLDQELRVLQRERKVQGMLKADMESIKASLERAQSKNVQRIEQDVDDANRECAGLRRRLMEEQDRFREITQKLEKQTSDAESRLLKEKHAADKATAQLEAMKVMEMQHLTRIDDLDLKLKEATNFMNTPSSNRIKELTLELTNHQTEIKALSDHLKSTQEQSENYCKIAEDSKAKSQELTEQFNKAKEEYESAQQKSEEQITSLQKRVEDLDKEMAKVCSEHQQSCAKLTEELSETEKELKELQGQNEILKLDLKTSTDDLAETKNNLMEQVKLYNENIEVLDKMKEENSALCEQLEKVTVEHNSAVTALEMHKCAIDEHEAKYQKENEEAQKKLDDLNNQNSLLRDQLQQLDEKFATLASRFDQLNGRESLETNKTVDSSEFFSFTNSESQKLDVSKSEDVKAENLELESQIDEENSNKKERIETERIEMSTDSNRMLHEERDALSRQVRELTEKAQALSTEMSSLREKAVGFDRLTQENDILQTEVTRWRQQVDAMTENENKVLTERLSVVEAEKIKMEEELAEVKKKMEENEDKERQNKQMVEKYKVELANLDEQMELTRSESEKLHNEIRDLTQKHLEKEEKSIELLKKARHKIGSLQTTRENQEKEIAELKQKLQAELTTSAETQANFAAMEVKYAKLSSEHTQILAEKEALSQRIESTLCQQESSEVDVVTESTAGRTNTRASNSTSPRYSSPAAYPSMTETSSPTSSHTEYQPESTSESESGQCDIDSKRKRSDEADEMSVDQDSSPRLKRSRSDIEYQVATSSQRDQDEEGTCFILVQCDESAEENRDFPVPEADSEMEEGRALQCVEVEIKSDNAEIIEVIDVPDDSASSTAGPTDDDASKVNVSNVNADVGEQETAAIDLSAKKSPNTQGVSTYRQKDPQKQDTSESSRTETASSEEEYHSPSHNTRRKTQELSSPGPYYLRGSNVRTSIRGVRKKSSASTRGTLSVRETREEGTTPRGRGRGRPRGRSRGRKST